MGGLCSREMKSGTPGASARKPGARGETGAAILTRIPAPFEGHQGRIPEQNGGDIGGGGGDAGPERGNRGVGAEEEAPSSPSARPGSAPRRDPRRCVRPARGASALSAPIQTDNARLASS